MIPTPEQRDALLTEIQRLGQEMEASISESEGLKLGKWRSVHSQEFQMPAAFPKSRGEYHEQLGVELRREDGGQALIVETNPVGEDCMFIRIHSWEEDPRHRCEDAHFEMMGLLGKRCRVTVEVLDE